MNAYLHMAALVWMVENDSEFNDAEFVVRAARPTRWPTARFSPSDVARAAKAITLNQHYLSEVGIDAQTTAIRAGIGGRLLADAINRLRAVPAAPEGEQP